MPVDSTQGKKAPAILVLLIKIGIFATYFANRPYKKSLQSARLRQVTKSYFFNMYVIVDIQGQQFKVQQGQKLFVHRLKADEGSEVEFEKVMLIDNEGNVTVGTPVIEGAKVVAEVLSHVKGDKVLVFKKKRRKGYQKLNGHRQQFSQIQVKEIIA